MKLAQVGIAALRGPDGSFLPAVPLYADITPEQEAEGRITEERLEQIFIERMKAYAAEKKGRNNL